MLLGLVTLSFRRYSDPFQSLGSLIVGPVSTAPIPLHPSPYRIIPPDRTICRVPIGSSNSIIAGCPRLMTPANAVCNDWRECRSDSIHVRSLWRIIWWVASAHPFRMRRLPASDHHFQGSLYYSEPIAVLASTCARFSRSAQGARSNSRTAVTRYTSLYANSQACDFKALVR